MGSEMCIRDRLTEDIYTAFQPVIDLGVDVAATNDSIVTNSVSDLISASQFQSLIFAILSSMFFLIMIICPQNK